MNKVGPYEIIAALGEGGMGTVYRAQDPNTKTIVALKTVRVAKGSLLRSIRREILALASLTHPGIVRICDEGLHECLPWYAMELLAGQSLSQWIQDPRTELRTSLEETQTLTKTLAESSLEDPTTSVSSFETLVAGSSDLTLKDTVLSTLSDSSTEHSKPLFTTIKRPFAKVKERKSVALNRMHGA
jgi:hypothetical protein